MARRIPAAVLAAAAGVGGEAPLFPGMPFGWFDAEQINLPDATPFGTWPNLGSEGNAGWVSQMPEFFRMGGPGDGNDKRVFFDNASAPIHYMQTPQITPSKNQNPNGGVVIGVIEATDVMGSFNCVTDADDSLPGPTRGWRVLLVPATGALTINAGTTLNAGVSFGSSWGYFVAEFDGGTSRIRTNGGVDVSGDAGNLACNRIRLALTSSLGAAFDGSLALLGHYSDGTTGDTLLTYLQNRYPSL